MDTSDIEIVFDERGICNHCRSFDNQKVQVVGTPEIQRKRLESTVDQIKAAGKGREFDCLIGVSGGVDSTYVAYLVKSLGLRPLAIHMDNGWNSVLAVSNIKRTLDALDIPLDTEVLEWEEFRDLQLAFLKASTPDSEIPTDHAIQAVLLDRAKKYDVKYIVTGSNVSSEAVMPRSWSYGIRDWKYIKGVHDRFGTVPLKTFPHFTMADFILSRAYHRHRWVNILDDIDYDKAAAMELIERELGWVYYGGKHYESVYTRFFQAYILPQKFGADKRRAHLSTLVLSGTITREQALLEIQQPICDPKLLRQDNEFVIKKLAIAPEEFEAIMNAPTKSIYDYPAYEHSWWMSLLRGVYRLPRVIRGFQSRSRPSGAL